MSYVIPVKQMIELWWFFWAMRHSCHSVLTTLLSLTLVDFSLPSFVYFLPSAYLLGSPSFLHSVFFFDFLKAGKPDTQICGISSLLNSSVISRISQAFIQHILQTGPLLSPHDKNYLHWVCVCPSIHLILLNFCDAAFRRWFCITCNKQDFLYVERFCSQHNNLNYSSNLYVSQQKILRSLPSEFYKFSCDLRQKEVLEWWHSWAERKI